MFSSTMEPREVCISLYVCIDEIHQRGAEAHPFRPDQQRRRRKRRKKKSIHLWKKEGAFHDSSIGTHTVAIAVELQQNPSHIIIPKTSLGSSYKRGSSRREYSFPSFIIYKDVFFSFCCLSQEFFFLFFSIGNTNLALGRTRWENVLSLKLNKEEEDYYSPINVTILIRRNELFPHLSSSSLIQQRRPWQRHKSPPNGRR